MNRLLKTSAGLLSTILIAAGANSVAGVQNACPSISDVCGTANVCSETASNCITSNEADLQCLIDSCNTNSELLKALIESGNCSSNDLQCLIGNGTCTLNDVCQALESCDTDCGNIADIIQNADCTEKNGCVDGDTACGTDIGTITSLFESLAAKSEENKDCSSSSITECVTSKETSEKDCSTSKSVSDKDCSTQKTAGDKDCSTPKTVSDKDCSTLECNSSAAEKTEKVTSAIESNIIRKDKSCDSSCDVNSYCEDTLCTDNSCEESDCTDGSCGNDNLNSILKQFGISENDININGSYDCSNGKCTVTYGNIEDLNDILKSFGFGTVPNPKNDSKPVEENTENNDTTVSEPEKSAPVENNNSYSVSAYEQEVVDRVNEIRESYGLNALKLNEKLSSVARTKSEDMRDKKYFSHNSPTYGSPFDMMKTFGINYRTAGENIAMGQRTPEEVVNAWMNSEGHRANILNSSFTEIGVGYAENGNYWTQMFIG